MDRASGLDKRKWFDPSKIFSSSPPVMIDPSSSGDGGHASTLSSPGKVTEKMKNERVVCVQGILRKRGRFGIFGRPWVERRFVLNYVTQKLYVGTEEQKNLIVIDLIGAQVKELAPKHAGGMYNAFEVLYRKSHKGESSETSTRNTKRERLMVCADCMGDKVFWMNAITGASDGSSLRQMEQQKVLDAHRAAIVAKLDLGEPDEAFEELERAVRVIEKSLEEGSLALAENTRDFAVYVSDPQLLNDRLIQKFKKRLNEASNIFLYNGKADDSIQCEIHYIKLLIVEEDFEGATSALLKSLAAVQKREGLKNKRSIEFLVLLGDNCEAQFLYNDATKYLEQALSLSLKINGTVHASVAKLTLRVGQVYLASNRQKNAVESFEIAHRIFTKALGPKNRDTILAQCYLGLGCLRLEEYEKASRYLVSAEEWSIQNADYSMAAMAQTHLAETYLKLLNFDNGLQVCENGLYSYAQTNCDHAAISMVKGRIYHSLGNLQTAVHDLEDAIREDQPRSLMHIRRLMEVGIIFVGIEGMEARGLELLFRARDYSVALKGCPCDWEVLAAIADYKIEHDDPHAIDLYIEALAIKHDRGNVGLKYAHLSMKLGSTFIKQGKPKLSLKPFQEAATIYSTREKPRDAGLAYLKIGQIQASDDLDSASKTFEQARRSLEGTEVLPYVLLGIGLLFLKLKEALSVIEATSSGLSITVGKSDSHYITAALLTCRGDAYLQMAARDDVDDGQTIYGRAQSDYAMAVVEMRARSSENPGLESQHAKYVVKLVEEEELLSMKDIIDKQAAARKLEKEYLKATGKKKGWLKRG